MTTNEFSPSGFFVLRTPLMPFSELEAWGRGLEAANADDDDLPAALERDRARARDHLRRLVTLPEMRDALFVASPQVEEDLDFWERDFNSERGRSLEPVLAAYCTRAATRATPFGLFAGISVGGVSDRTRLHLQARSRYRRHSRLDMDYLWALSDALERDKLLRPDLVYRPNSTLCDVGGRLRIVEVRFNGTSRSYHLVAFEKTPYLVETLARAAHGATLAQLTAALVDDEITETDADEFVNALIDNQILVSEVRPPLTGSEPGPALLAGLAHKSGADGVVDRLADAHRAMSSIDADGVGVATTRYRAIADSLRVLGTEPQLSRLVQVDMFKPAEEMTLGSDVIKEIERGVRVLHSLAPSYDHDSLARFREEFVRRYETREVPLVEALDEESGIGFERSDAPGADASPLLAGLALPRPHRSESPQWAGRDSYLLDRLLRAAADRAPEIVLDRDEVAVLLRNAPARPLPDAYEVLATLAAESEDAVARGSFRVLIHSATGPSGARIVGRFCHVDHVLEQAVRRHLQEEEAVHPDRIYAEIVHLPEGRVGNILSRPVLRSHEIPYLATSGAPEGAQIPVTDLLVSVVGDRIVLRSRRLAREVVPRLTTTHNYGWRSLGVYRFLCSLQRQGVESDLTWNWGPLGQAPFLPRIVAGRSVLSRARWRLRAADMPALRSGDSVERFRSVQRLRARDRLPRHVALADGDNELVADLDNVLSVEALLDQLRGRDTASLIEVFPAPHELCVRGPEGRFVHELAVPFVRSPGSIEPSARRRALSAGTRRFPPGSEWLYLKLYGGTASADEVLDRAGRLLEEAVARGDADGWFFIRFGDPDAHLRLRVHGVPEALQSAVRPRLEGLAAALIDDGRIWRVQLDTYEREVERYGGDEAIRLAEHVFSADSRAVVAVVRTLTGDAGADLRWRVALKGVDMLFDDLGLDFDGKRAVARGARDGYRRELVVGREFQQRVSRRFRDERAELEGLLDPRRDAPPPLRTSMTALGQRSAALAGVAEELRALARRGTLTATVADIALSHAHMHVNRVLRTAQRAHELVIYEFLDRLYTSAAARGSAP